MYLRFIYIFLVITSSGYFKYFNEFISVWSDILQSVILASSDVVEFRRIRYYVGFLCIYLTFLFYDIYIYIYIYAIQFWGHRLPETNEESLIITWNQTLNVWLQTSLLFIKSQNLWRHYLKLWALDVAIIISSAIGIFEKR